MNLQSIFNSYYDKIYSFTLMRVCNVHDAEDIASDVFVKVAEKLDTYKPEKAAFSTWLFTIAVNEINTYYRRRKNVISIDEFSDIADTIEIDENLLWIDERMCVNHAFSCLDDRQKEIVLLKYFGELTHRQIAETTGISETNAETILNRAKKEMKKVFNSCEESKPCAYKEIRGEDNVR